MAPSGAGDEAVRNARIATATYAATIVIPGGLSRGVEGAMEHVGTAALRHGVEIATHAGTEVALEVVGESLHGHAHGDVGLTAIQYSNIQVGSQALRGNAPREQAATRALNNAGVAVNLQTRAGLLAMYLAEHGTEISAMTPAQVEASVSTWLRAHGTVTGGGSGAGPAT